MNYHFLSETGAKEIGAELHNPPNELGPEFQEEWWGVRSSLDSHLSKRARRVTRFLKRPADYSLSEYAGESRSMQIFLHNYKLLETDFCEYIASLLRGLDEDYHIHCFTETHDRWYFRKKPVYYLMISREASYGHCKSVSDTGNSWTFSEDFRPLERIGFPPHATSS